ncbi:MAG: sigma factor [Hydrogeniiclostridium mannosilyticum]
MPRISLAVAEKLHKVYGEFSHLMYSEAFGILSNRDDAEDSVQEACMNIMRSPQTLMRIEDAETLQPYLRIVARNAAKQVWVKRRYHFREISLESNLDWIDNIPTPIVCQ